MATTYQSRWSATLIITAIAVVAILIVAWALGYIGTATAPPPPATTTSAPATPAPATPAPSQ